MWRIFRATTVLPKCKIYAELNVFYFRMILGWSPIWHQVEKLNSLCSQEALWAFRYFILFELSDHHNSVIKQPTEMHHHEAKTIVG